MSAHPKDEWFEVTALGATEPQFVLGFSGWDHEIGQARAEYLADRIPVEEFERRIGEALTAKVTP